jgi:hypothetical protein
MHFCVVHQATRSGIENRVANRACRAIQPSISSSIQPTERAPSDTWRGNSPFAIRTCVRTSTWLAAGGPIEPTGQCYRASHGQGIDLETTQSMQGYFWTACLDWAWLGGFKSSQKSQTCSTVSIKMHRMCKFLSASSPTPCTRRTKTDEKTRRFREDTHLWERVESS